MRANNKIFRTQAKSDIRLVEEKLRAWDPIGVIPDLLADGHPPDEYDSYAPHIVGLLARGATVEELTAHLEYCRTGAMGLGKDRAADRKLAEELIELWRKRGVERSASSPAGQSE